uniref:Uncharacterized protein n=1 Tax=Anguilla anguilla TaxID=7936 RepID=A0A0E9VPS8_ANGAN
MIYFNVRSQPLIIQ